MRRFSIKQPQTHCLVSIPSQARWETAKKCTFCRIACLRGKKCKKSTKKNWKKEISFSESGGAAWLLTKQFQFVGLVLPQFSLRARGPRGTTAAVQVCGGREREGIFLFFGSFSDSWSVRSWGMDALKSSLCLAEATAEVGTAGNGLWGTLCAAAAPCFPLELFQEAWLFVFLGDCR